MIAFDPKFGPIIAQRAGGQFNPGDAVVCRLDDKTGELIGGVIYQGYTGVSIAMHSASWRPMWLTRGFLYVIFAYPFIQLQCERVFGQVPSNNERAIKLNLNIGFRIVATIPKVFRGNIDCLVMSMEREECRFIQGNKGEARSLAA